jgi:hypothetical protein
MLRGAAPATGRTIRSLRAPISVATLLIAVACLGILTLSPMRAWDSPGPYVFYPFWASGTSVGLGISAWVLGGAWLLAFSVFGASWLSRPRPWWALPVLVFAGLVFIYGLLDIIGAFVARPL